MQQEPAIIKMADDILDMCEPVKIIIFSKKYDMSQELASFKLCVIVPDYVDIAVLEYKLYLELECDNSFDVLLYRVSEWEHICVDDASFANKILKNGVVLYES